MQNAWEIRETYSKFCSENLKGRDHLEDKGVDGKIILEWTVEKYGLNV
jgi:hypothetical protein